jgi:hypothetical protein
VLLNISAILDVLVFAGEALFDTVKALLGTEMVGINHPSTKCHIPYDLESS